MASCRGRSSILDCLKTKCSLIERYGRNDSKTISDLKVENSYIHEFLDFMSFAKADLDKERMALDQGREALSADKGNLNLMSKK